MTDRLLAKFGRNASIKFVGLLAPGESIPVEACIAEALVRLDRAAPGIFVLHEGDPAFARQLLPEQRTDLEGPLKLPAREQILRRHGWKEVDGQVELRNRHGHLKPNDELVARARELQLTKPASFFKDRSPLSCAADELVAREQGKVQVRIDAAAAALATLRKKFLDAPAEDIVQLEKALAEARAQADRRKAFAATAAKEEIEIAPAVAALQQELAESPEDTALAQAVAAAQKELEDAKFRAARALARGRLDSAFAVVDGVARELKSGRLPPELTEAMASASEALEKGDFIAVEKAARLLPDQARGLLTAHYKGLLSWR